MLLDYYGIATSLVIRCSRIARMFTAVDMRSPSLLEWFTFLGGWLLPFWKQAVLYVYAAKLWEKRCHWKLERRIYWMFQGSTIIKKHVIKICYCLQYIYYFRIKPKIDRLGPLIGSWTTDPDGISAQTWLTKPKWFFYHFEFELHYVLWNYYMLKCKAENIYLKIRHVVH